MTPEQLLGLVPRFNEGLRKSLQPIKTLAVNIASVNIGTNVIDPNYMGVDIIIQGKKKEL